MMNELIKTRFELGSKRINEIYEEEFELLESGEKLFFKENASFLILLCDICHMVVGGTFELKTQEELQTANKKVYENIAPVNYEKSFCNPQYAVNMTNITRGQLLSAISAEMRGAIPAAYEGDMEGLVIRMELFLEIVSIYMGALEDEQEIEDIHIRDAFYSYYHDYLETQTENKIACQLIPRKSCFDPLVNPESINLSVDEGVRRLYLTGEYISDNEVDMYRYLMSIPQERLEAMADTYVGGYVKGFEVTGRDLSIKDTAEVRFHLGFAPMIRYAGMRLSDHNLNMTMMRAGYSIFTGRSVDKNGVFGGNINPQFDLDHKSDLSLILDDALVEYRLDTLRDCYVNYKDQARALAGPAVIDIFGESDFEPVIKPEAADYTVEGRALVTRYSSQAGQIVNEFIPGDERSFTIIAFPLPSIGDDFEAIFDDTIRINTLDYMLYRDIQQKIIDALDTAEYVYVEGSGDNHTKLRVHLHELTDPSHQTNFENCVADVNIPVGEVFTSPLLTGTDGVLHVTRVFLNGLEYHNLSLTIKDGMISGYSCDEGNKLIEDNILFHHKSLPMGECAIGTNTTAYEVGRRYGIEDKLPILIAEKTGPHFAFGDTCYSHCEELAVYNPDGKEIIARDNECSLLRTSDPQKAYFNCHTDITIPYDELKRLSAIRKDGSEIVVIQDGHFVLEGCEELNKPLNICN